jgi:hypothetical protein
LPLRATLSSRLKANPPKSPFVKGGFCLIPLYKEGVGEIFGSGFHGAG